MKEMRKRDQKKEKQRKQRGKWQGRVRRAKKEIRGDDISKMVIRKQ